MKIAIVNGRVIDPASNFDARAGVFVEDGRISAMGDAPARFKPDRTIDVAGCIVVPGLVDICARLGEPGHEGALKIEMKAALAGGVTSIVCPPDTQPPLDEPGLVRMLRQRSRESAGARTYPLGALTAELKGQALAAIKTLSEAGCVAFMQTTSLPHDNAVLLQAMRYAKTFELPLWLRPVEDTLAGSGVAGAGAVAGRLGLPSVPVVAETVALHTIFELQRATGAQVHLCRLSSSEGIELVRQAKREGLPVTADVGIHHVHLIDIDIGYFDPNFRLDPPLRGARDRDAIVAALADDTIDAICSDHAPIGEDDKLLPFGEAAPGATALETLLPLTLKWATEQNVPLARALSKITSSPASILRKGAAKGRLTVGAKADIAIFDPAVPWCVGADTLASAGKNSPFSGYELQGRVRYTLVGGEVRHETQSGT
jgi:dihydroorotase